MLSRRNIRLAVIAAVVLGIAADLSLEAIRSRRSDSAQTAVAVARAGTKVALDSTAKSDSTARARETRADKAFSAGVALSRSAADAQLAASIARTAYRLDPSPARADTVFVADSVLIQALTKSRDSLFVAARGYKEALDTTQAALALLRATTVNLDAAARDLSRASKPSLARRILPRPFIGMVAGVDRLGTPNVTAGLGLGWSF